MLVHKKIKIKKVMFGNIQFVKVTNLRDEEGKNQTFFKPAVCYFDGKSITKFEGQDSDSLLIHSLDGNHENWAPENKVLTHHGCHQRFHCNGEKNPFFNKHHKPESIEKMVLAKTGENNPNFGKRGKGTPMYGKHHKSETKKKIGEVSQQMWNSMTPEERKERNRKVSEGVKQNWDNMVSEQRKERGRKSGEGKKLYWANMTPEERVEHGRRTSEGRKRAKLRREKNEH